MSHPFQAEADWDQYWTQKKRLTSRLYDLIAGFYRRWIIKKALNRFMHKHFLSGAKLLHAGCGSGQVDVDLVQHFKITAMDTSKQALNLYKKVNQHQCSLVRGDIFAIPFLACSFDGIYNLGVMEHFTETEIQKILSEFKRTLRVRGKIVLFWPPEFGLSVCFLKTLHFILNKIFKKNVKLHPNEITRVRSLEHVKSIIEQAGLEFVDYYFGSKDIFTQVMIVAQKK
jgi:ubiquinone/menaquinone biosynthesis C-methylase UbiE